MFPRSRSVWSVAEKIQEDQQKMKTGADHGLHPLRPFRIPVYPVTNRW